MGIEAPRITCCSVVFPLPPRSSHQPSLVALWCLCSHLQFTPALSRCSVAFCSHPAAHYSFSLTTKFFFFFLTIKCFVYEGAGKPSQPLPRSMCPVLNLLQDPGAETMDKGLKKNHHKKMNCESSS